MAELPPLEGFGYSQEQATAIAAALEATINQAEAAGASVPDRLAAVGIAAAAIVVGATRLSRNPEAAAKALAAFILSIARG